MAVCIATPRRTVRLSMAAVFFFFDAWGVDLGTLSSVEKKLQVVRWVSGRPI